MFFPSRLALRSLLQRQILPLQGPASVRLVVLLHVESLWTLIVGPPSQLNPTPLARLVGKVQFESVMMHIGRAEKKAGDAIYARESISAVAEIRDEGRAEKRPDRRTAKVISSLHKALKLPRGPAVTVTATTGVACQ